MGEAGVIVVQRNWSIHISICNANGTINRGIISYLVPKESSFPVLISRLARRAPWPRPSARSRCVFRVALFLLSAATAYGGLSQDFYAGTCPSLDRIIETEVSRALSEKGKRMGASLLRLFFHDCFVQGCDASVLLDASVPNSERNAGPNQNSLLGFDVIDQIKAKVEATCSRIVSCADILALAAREAVVKLGGPRWTLELGRNDSTTANRAQADTDLPGPSSSISDLIKKFGDKGFNKSELAALSGAHAIGKARCKFMNANQVLERKEDCPLCILSPDNMATPLDPTPEAFDTRYYDNVEKSQGLLHSDNELMKDQNLAVLVKQYISDQTKFLTYFAAAMTKLSELGKDNPGPRRVRIDCKKVN